MKDKKPSVLVREMKAPRTPRIPPHREQVRAEKRFRALLEAKEMKRASFIGAPEMFNLNQACRVVVDAFGSHLYLVGSSLTRRDYRDVDVRCILPDEEYARLFPGITGVQQYHALWSLLCSSISLYLSQHSGLPVDFQIQQQTKANLEYPDGGRNPLGLFHQIQKDEAGSAP